MIKRLMLLALLAITPLTGVAQSYAHAGPVPDRAGVARVLLDGPSTDSGRELPSPTNPNGPS